MSNWAAGCSNRASGKEIPWILFRARPKAVGARADGKGLERRVRPPQPPLLLAAGSPAGERARKPRWSRPHAALGQQALRNWVTGVGAELSETRAILEDAYCEQLGGLSELTLQASWAGIPSGALLSSRVERTTRANSEAAPAVGKPVEAGPTAGLETAGQLPVRLPEPPSG